MALPVVRIILRTGLIGAGGFLAGASFSETLGTAIQLGAIVAFIIAVVVVLQRLNIVGS